MPRSLLPVLFSAAFVLSCAAGGCAGPRAQCGPFRQDGLLLTFERLSATHGQNMASGEWTTGVTFHANVQSEIPDDVFAPERELRISSVVAGEIEFRPRPHKVPDQGPAPFHGAHLEWPCPYRWWVDSHPFTSTPGATKLDRVSGWAEVLRARHIIDLDVPLADAPMHEITPGLWIAIDAPSTQRRPDERLTYTLRTWSANQPLPEGMPAGPAVDTSGGTARARFPKAADDLKSFNPRLPPLVYEKLIITQSGRETELKSRGGLGVDDRSGFYQEMELSVQSDPADPPSAIRFRIITRIDTVLIPFELRDLPLTPPESSSARSPGPRPNPS